MTLGIMEVNLISAKGIKNDEFLGGGIDPYVVIQYKHQEHQSSVARGQGSRPVWNVKFTFRVEYPAADNNYKLILTVMDQDTFSADDYLGQATVYVKDLVELGIEKGKYETRSQNTAWWATMGLSPEKLKLAYLLLPRSKLMIGTEKIMVGGRKVNSEPIMDLSMFGQHFLEMLCGYR